MKIKSLLEVHAKNHTRVSLRLNLGDGYLINHNPIYARIREMALEQKFKFSAERFYDYDSFALTQLPEILAKRTIPYVDNVSPLHAIEKKAPGIFSLSTIPPLKSNHVFHESAHAVAHATIEKMIPKTSKSGKILEQEISLRVLFEESFANACESIANVYSATRVQDEFLFKNSYVMESEKIKTCLKKAMKNFGFAPTFRLVLISFLHANLLQTEANEKNLIRSIRIAFTDKPDHLSKLKNVDIRLLTQVFQAGLDLDTEFTEFTNRFCLRLLGIQTPLRQLFQFDFLSRFESGGSYAEAFTTLTHELSTV